MVSERKKATKAHKLYRSIYVKCPERESHRNKLLISGCQGWWKGEGEWLLIGMEFLFLGEEKLLVAQLCEYTKNHWVIYFKKVHFIFMWTISQFKRYEEKKPST